MFLANENFPKPSISLLQNAGYTVISIQQDLPGITDSEVINYAKLNNLIILTFDSDYGTLLFKYESKAPPAVIFFRIKGNDPNFAGELLIKMLENNGINFSNTFTVVDLEGYRQREYLIN